MEIASTLALFEVATGAQFILLLSLGLLIEGFDYLATCAIGRDIAVVAPTIRP